jgi:hypothetical protein
MTVGGGEISLVEQEFIGVDCLQPERAERRGGEVGQVRGDDSIGATPDRGRHDVPVVLVGQVGSWLEFFPASDQYVVEGLAHAGEALGGIDAGVDFLDGVLCLGEDAV